MSSSIEHNELSDLLRQSLDRQLSPAEQKRLDTGLEEHASLREELVELQNLRSSLRKLHPQPSSYFTNSVMQQLSEQQQLLRPLIVRWRSIAAAACIALLLAAGLIYSSNGDLETESILGLEQMELDDVYAFED